MTMPHITLMIAGLCGLLQFALTIYVIARRAQTGVSFLDGGDPQLLRRIRAHGNLTETAPMALLLMLLLEMRNFSVTGLWIFGGLLIVGRLLNAHSILTNNAAWSRRGGTVMTLLVISIQAALCLWLFAR
jgi:uncharacterized protein